MFKIDNFYDNKNVNVMDNKGCMTVIQHVTDMSVSPGEAQVKYYMSKMGCTQKQLIVNLNNNGVILQKGVLQWMVGDVGMTSGLRGAGDLMKKAFAGRVTGEAAIKPEYRGSGVVVCEPTYKHLLLEDLSSWGGSVIIEDGLFMASDATVQHSVVVSGAGMLGGEGLFNLCLSGQGIVCLECCVPREELILVTLQDDVLKIDGKYAIAWSKSLAFSVERSGKSLMGSAASGEGLVNVYRGTGQVLMQPLD